MIGASGLGSMSQQMPPSTPEINRRRAASPDPDRRVWFGRLTTLDRASGAHGLVLRMDSRERTGRSRLGKIRADCARWPEPHQGRVASHRMTVTISGSR